MAKHGRQQTPEAALATEADLQADAEKAARDNEQRARADAVNEARAAAAQAAVQNERKRTGLNYQDKFAVVALLVKGFSWEEAKAKGAPTVQDAALEGHKDELLAQAKKQIDQRQMNERLAAQTEAAARVLRQQAETARSGPLRSGLDRNEQRRIAAFLRDGRKWEQAVHLGIDGRVEPKVLAAWRPTLEAAAELWTEGVEWEIALKRAAEQQKA